MSNLAAELRNSASVNSKATAWGEIRSGTFAASCRSRARAASPFEMLHDLGQRHRVQNPLCRYASLASHFDPPVHVIELGNRVRVGVDAEHAPEVKRALVPAPVQIQPPRVSVDLNSDSVLGAGTEHRLNVNVVA